MSQNQTETSEQLVRQQRGDCFTRVPFVLHSDVDCVCVADEAEGRQLAVDVNLAGDNIDG